ATITSSSVASGGTGTITYQWQQSTDNSIFTDITGATATTYSPGVLTQTTYYKRGARTSVDAIVYTGSIKITVESSIGGTISGSATVCANTNSTTLSLSGNTGTITKWQSSTQADFSTAIDVVNITSGLTATNLTATTYYRAVVQLNSCAIVNSSTSTVTVNALPVISGTLSVCVNSTTALSGNGTPGGTPWATSNGSVATVSNVGVVTGVSSGTVTITYTNNNGCAQTATVTVNALPVIASITGSSSVCIGSTIPLANTTVDGTWSSGTTGVATISGTGVLSGVAAGSSVINYSYTDGNGCTASISSTKTVNALPVVSSITGLVNVCIGSTIPLANVTTGGTWSSGTPGVATISSIGVVTGVASGTSVINYSYTDANGCNASVSSTKTVNALPTVTITTPSTQCTPSTINLTDATITTGSSAGLTLGYFSDAIASNSLTTPTAIASSGTYYVKGTNANNCSVVKPVMVTINPNPSININQPAAICSPGTVDITATINIAGSTSGLTYTYFTDAIATQPVTAPTTVGTTGTYYIKGTTADNCSVIKPVTVSINALPAVTITNPVAVCNPASVNLTAATITAGSSTGLAYTYFSDAATSISIATPTVISVSGTYYIKATNTANCTVSKPVVVSINASPNLTITNPAPVCAPGSANLIAAAITRGSTAGLVYSHWLDAAASLPLNNAGAITTGGTYYIKAATAEGCSVIQAVTANILSQPNLVVNYPAAVCAPATVNLLQASITAGSTAGLNFSYYTDSINTNALVTPSAVAAPGTYYIKGTLPSGCSMSKQVIVIINPSPSFQITQPAPVCEPETVNITSPNTTDSPGYTYWKDPAHTIPLTTPYAINSSGIYYIKGVFTNGCLSLLPITVTINPLPNGTLQTVTENFICDGSSQILKASNAFAYQWYRDQNSIPGATADSFAATTAGNYTVQFMSKEGCSKVASNNIRLDLLTKPILQFKPGNVCAGLPVIFSNNSSIASSGGINWLWDFGDGASSNSFSPVHSFQQTGTYAISLKAINTSCATLTEQITTAYTISAAPAGARYDTITAVNEKSFVLNARSIGSIYLWQPAWGLNNATLKSPTATLSNETDFTIRITNAAGCVTTDSVFVKLAGTGEIFVGQGFTPNGDGVNDKCYPLLSGIRSLTYFKIFNRWGNQVFQTNDATPQNGWDGKLAGRMQPAGTYLWIAEAIDGSGKVIKRSGNVILINN
ncbi:MAG: gliding motility-associated C-terminal domain-containing protein, partial [Sediminibacterium sp.]|nr:gliding motility-associated C-terminal domain-containing protein [Sediminibacterium sp.]